MYLSKPLECKNQNLSYGLWVIMMCQRRFINFNKWTTLAGDVDNEEGCACAKVEGILCISFNGEPRTVLINKAYF